MVFATGVGSHPGDEQRDFDEAVAVVLGELAHDERGLPYLPEVPGRGAIAGMIGRTLAVVTEIGIDLQPAGWRLTDASGVDHRRARSLLSQDLDTLEEQAAEYAGAFKVQLTGPWTLAAMVEKPRGDKVLADIGARRDLAQALAAGVSDHVADVRRRLPGVDRLVVQLDEPALPAVLAGSVATASGFHRHRSVDLPLASQSLEWVLRAVADAGAEPWVHSCAGDMPWGMVRDAGSTGLLADLGVTGPGGHDALAEAVEAGSTVVLGVAPGSQVTERVLRWCDLVGFDPAEIADRLGMSGPCGFAGTDRSVVRAAIEYLRQGATSLS